MQLYKLAHAVIITAGVGRMDKAEFLKRWTRETGLSYKTLYKSYAKFKELGFWQENDGKVYMCGKKSILIALGQRLNRTHVKFSDQKISSYKEFKKHCIVQCGIYYQKKFKYSHKELVENVNSTSQCRSIAFPISKEKRKVGVASRYLAKKLELSRTTIRQGLKGKTKLNFEDIEKIDIKELKRLGKQNFFKENPRIGVKKLGKGQFMLRYSLPSTIIEISSLGRDNRISRTLPLSLFNSLSKYPEKDIVDTI